MNISSEYRPLVKKPNFKILTKSPRILQVFLGADLRGSHNSLILLGNKYGLDLINLENNQAVVFINKAKTLMKIYVSGNTFSYTRRDRIDLEAIKHLPRAFGYDGEFDYDKALGISLEERLGRKRRNENSH